ncbi:DNA polymerase III, subunit gamma and tau [Candidatus Roizmanbacteria bacterium RIFCSPHIGHO2_02_FULL_40_9]|uniref:DNA polymerase III subunit gamma/tau n=2 Tax=Candidatus Roizmaniibacteriota TaxID=1752723 RepID=A0A1F7IMC8_9BACT|nr:MAG: DNA polymerase III, subunit gamma and tau [Candidatus Roizmanbacteria bacterium RIFCSPHIGHO2_02_FULL_40_9]OGK44523.1 MAG: DNA polymerase III, subunit gamma and tau [Candidatus Roizmanbacteria bacterium RIFCSPLOWO2_01_FULL_38_11]
MYYLKYRPQTLEHLDNENIKDQLLKILSSSSLPHAFLFTGPKGTGKTSTARIVAKAINCEKNLFAKGKKSVEPCNECQNCSAITKGTSVDVVEMDAASNRRIDDIRELISKLAFTPIALRYKVYIIDEVHMLTKEAFNALLKSLEEPPKTTIFILATTEPDALPKTIISRCINLHFTYAKTKDISSMIRRIQKEEKLSISEPVIEFISQHSEGSFRDASKILELAVMQGDLSIEGIQKILGHHQSSINILSLIEKKDLKATIAWIEEMSKKGSDFKILIESLLNDLQQHLLKKNGIEVERISEYNFSIKETATLISLLQEAYQQLKYVPIQSLPLQIAVIEYCQTNKV